MKNIIVSSDFFIGKYTKDDLKNTVSQETFLQSGSAIKQEDLDKMSELNIHTLTIADVDFINKGPYLIDTLNIDKNNTNRKRNSGNRSS